MIDLSEIKRWLGTLHRDSRVAVDEGGLCLAEIDAEGNETGAHLEIGGVPETEEDRT